MKCIVFIALAALVGTIAAQGYGPINHRYRGPPREPPHELKDQHGPHRGPPGGHEEHGPHPPHFRPRRGKSRRPPHWDDSSDSGPSDSSDSSGPSSESSSDDSDWHFHHRPRCPRRPGRRPNRRSNRCQPSTPKPTNRPNSTRFTRRPPWIRPTSHVPWTHTMPPQTTHPPTHMPWNQTTPPHTTYPTRQPWTLIIPPHTTPPPTRQPWTRTMPPVTTNSPTRQPWTRTMPPHTTPPPTRQPWTRPMPPHTPPSSRRPWTQSKPPFIVTTWRPPRSTPQTTPRFTTPTRTMGPPITTWHPTTHTVDTTHWITTTSYPETTTSSPETTTFPPETTTNVEGPTTMSPEIQSCINACHSTPEFNPVCGTNGVTYENEGKLFCAFSCGVDVKLRRRSLCPPPVFDGNDGESTPPPTFPPTTLTTPSTTSSFMGRTTPVSSFHRCMKQCRITPSFTPVCGTDLVTYMNMDRLKCAQSCGEVVQVLCEKPCAVCGFNPVTTPKTTTIVTTTSGNIGRTTLEPDLKECIRGCPVTTEYNPVCGTDHLTYNNPSHLLCAQICGVGVSVARMSPCSSRTTTSSTTTEFPSTTLSPTTINCIRRCPVTAEYNPVCGSDGYTYTSLGHLHCARYCGIEVDLKGLTRCEGELDIPTFGTDSTPSPTTKMVDIQKGKETTLSQTTMMTTSRPRPSTIWTTTPSPTLTTTSSSISSTTIGFSIPPDILITIFGSTEPPLRPPQTTQPTTTSTTTVRTTTESDEHVNIDARYGNDTDDNNHYSRIIFPE